MKERTKVLIIGGGVNGCALAYYLAERGADVTLLERGYIACGSSGRNAGGIRQQWSTRENVRLAMGSVKIFERLDEELGCETDYRQGGYLILAHTEEEVKQFKRNVSMQRSEGLKVEYLEQDEINDIVPELNVEGIGAIGATWCPTDGHADPIKVTIGYAEAAMKKGAQIYKYTEVLGFRVKDNEIVEVKTSKGSIKTDYVVNAAGAYSREIAKLLGVQLPNKPYRHEILITEPVKPFFTPMIISFHDNFYFRQTPEGQIIGGWGNPKEEPGYNYESSLTFAKNMARLLARYMPKLRHINILRQWAGLYDVTPDARPILGPVEMVRNFIQMNGFSGHGFMVAPMTATLISQLIMGEKTTLPIENLSLERFRGEVTREVSVVG